MPNGMINFAPAIMAKKKLERFAEMKGFNCVYEPDMEDIQSGEYALKGKWCSDHFKNDHPITLELGCGKGEYTVELARRNPDRNFIGVDVKGARMWRGSKTAHSEGLENVVFLRTKIEFIEAFFAPGEVSEIWLTFSDPQPKDRKGTKRLTGAPFLERYRRIMKPDGIVHLKTDSTILSEATLDTLREEGIEPEVVYDDVHGSDRHSLSAEEAEVLDIRTFYERMFLEKGKKINYIRFRLSERVGENIG